MEMIDVGVTPTKETAGPAASPKMKKYYPSFSVEKTISAKMGQEIVAEGKVVGMRKDRYGNSITIEVRRIGLKRKVSVEDFEKMSDEEQDKELSKGR